MPPSLEAQAREKAIADERLKERLRTMKPGIDNSPPQTFTHIGGGNSKKATLDAARQKEIDAGNARLLANLTSIASGGATMDTGIRGERPLNRGEAPAHAGPSMMASRHKAEQERIAAENAKLLSRITATATRKTELSPATLAKDFETQQGYMKRISRYPPPK